MNIVVLLVGLVILVAGGELLVRGASGIAERLGMSPTLVGLTVVAVATGTPEFAVSMGALLNGEPGLAVGNVAGSNIANVGLVLGLGATVTALTVGRSMLRLDAPLMMGATAFLVLMAWDLRLEWWEALLLILVFATHLFLCVREARRSPEAPPTESGASTRPHALIMLLFVVLGVALLVAGSQLMVDSATKIALSFGVSTLLIGLTVVAVGTSLPEIVTTVVALRRGETGLALGNAVGSNIVNIGLVLGVPTLLAGHIDVPDSAARIDLPVALGAALLLLLLASTHRRISRWEGVLLLAGYIGYVTWTVMNAVA